MGQKERKTSTQGFRFEQKMLDAIDREKALTEAAQPGLRLSRADMVRMLVAEALATRAKSRKEK